MVVLEEEDSSGKKSFRPVLAREMTKKEHESVVRQAMATDDPDNSAYLSRLKSRMDRYVGHTWDIRSTRENNVIGPEWLFCALTRASGSCQRHVISCMGCRAPKTLPYR